MTNKELYDSFISYAQNREFEKAVGVGASWLYQEKQNPFQTNTKEHELFFKAKKAMEKWQLGGIDSRVSRVRMEKHLVELGTLNALNPYNPVEAGFRVLGVVPEKKEEAKAATNVPVEDAEPITGNQKNELTHVLGVIPEEKPKFFKRRKE